MVASSFSSAHFVRVAALVTLCIQNAANTLLIRYSRGVLRERYSQLSTVLVSECVKLLLAIAMLYQHPPDILQQSATIQASKQDVDVQVTHDDALIRPRSHKSSKMRTLIQHCGWVLISRPGLAVPGGVYLIQNILQQLALQYLPAGTYALVAQLKLLTTAFFSIWLLGRRLNMTQIRALLLLFIGVVLVLQAGNIQQQTQTQTTTITHISTNPSPTNTNDISLPEQVPSTSTSTATTSTTIVASYWMFGLTCAIGVSMLSGFGGCYLESLFKSAPTPTSAPLSLWEANVGLSIWGLLFGCFSLVLLPSERDPVMQYGFFHHYSVITVCVVASAAGGGIIVAIVVKYADNIIKNFAVTLAIVLTSLCSWYWFDDVDLNGVFIGGASVVIIAIANYNDASISSSSSTTTTTAQPHHAQSHVQASTPTEDRTSRAAEKNQRDDDEIGTSTEAHDADADAGVELHVMSEREPLVSRNER